MSLVESCQHHLEQARTLALRLDPSEFSCAHALCYGSTIGQHLRHCVDHVECFLDGLNTGRVDYDVRVRGLDWETQPEAAVARIEANILRLQHLSADEAGKLLVKLDCGELEDPWRTSTVGRELQFLVSHLVHHFAIVSIMCHSQGIDTGGEFGIAPSTLRHRASA